MPDHNNIGGVVCNYKDFRQNSGANFARVGMEMLAAGGGLPPAPPEDIWAKEKTGAGSWSLCGVGAVVSVGVGFKLCLLLAGCEEMSS